MAYLLTEIALEMLGCKYYDIYGKEQEMNDFQDEQNADIKHLDENSLDTILQFSKKCTSTKNVGLNQNEKMESPEVECAEFIEEIAPKPMVKLMKEEYNNVRKQILQNRKVLLSRRNAYTNDNIVRLMARDSLDKEIVKLRWEAQTIRNFRRMVERSIMEINAMAFQKYCITFATGIPLNIDVKGKFKVQKKKN